MGLTISQQRGTRLNGEVAPATTEEIEQIRKRIKKLNDWALLLGVVGFGMQGFGRASEQGLLVLSGTCVMVGALAIYARMRGRQLWWGALGLFSIVGLVALYLLPKRCHHCGATVKEKSCSACGAPAPL